MRGVVKTARGHGHVELREVEPAPPGPGQVQVKVEAAGICGSDLHIYHDTISYNIRTPVVMGHEFAGTVVALGEGAGDGISIGDRVTGEPSIHICGHCDYCRGGHYNMCSDRQVMGYYHDGCFASTVNARFVHRLPATVSFEAGALTELLACCVHSVIEQAGVTAGDLVAVIGPGPVGLFASLVAMAEGGRLRLATGTDNGSVRVRIGDTGHGISSEDVSHVFDAFFTTKRHGTGLGLSLARKIVEQHGGRLCCTSLPDVGTTFEIVLDAADREETT